MTAIAINPIILFAGVVACITFGAALGFWLAAAMVASARMAHEEYLGALEEEG